jgi:hypothetical protein
MLTRRGVVGALQRFASIYDQLLSRWETLCPDGTRAISTWNALLERWETTITPPAGSPRSSPWPRDRR